MTNFEKTKKLICESIQTMTEKEIKLLMCDLIACASEDVLFEFLSDYDEDDGERFPKGAWLTCYQCRELYGGCDADYSDEANYEMCKDRFRAHCRKECE